MNLEDQNTTTDEAVLSEIKSGRFPTWVDLLAIFGLFFVTQLITGFIFLWMGWTTLYPDNFVELTAESQRVAEYTLGRSTFLWTIISQPLMLLFVLIYRTIRRGEWRAVHFSVNGFNPTILLWGMMMLISMVVVIEPILQLFPDTPSPAGRGLYMILALVVVAPIFEELLCRGVIFEAVRNKWGALAACVVSAVIFGVMHIEPQFVINAFMIGLLLSYVYLRTNSIFAPILLHSINNILAYIFLIFGISELSMQDLLGDGVLYKVIYGCSVVLLLLSLIAVSRTVARLDKEDRAKRRADKKIKSEEVTL